MWGRTWQSPCPRPFILGMPPPYGFTLHIVLLSDVGGYNWYWVVIRYKNEPLMVIKMIFRIHNHSSQK
jgi:hypothetical protein